MKKMINVFVVIALFCVCDVVHAQEKVYRSSDYSVVNLRTGETIQPEYRNGQFLDQNNQAVDYYIIRYNNLDLVPDTVHGVTGIVVNGSLYKNSMNNWDLDPAKVKWDGNSWKVKNKKGYKVKWDKDTLKVNDWGNPVTGTSRDGWNEIAWRENW